MRWIFWPFISLYLVITEEIAKERLVRSNYKRYLSAREWAWKSYIYYDRKKGWRLAEAIAFPPTPEMLTEVPFWSKDGCLELERFHLEQTEIR